MSDPLDFLQSQPQGEEEPQPPLAEPVQEAGTDAPPPRGPDGKFVAKVEAPAPQEAGLEAPPQSPVEPGHVPLSAMLGEREKRQGLERRLAELEAQRAPPPPLEPNEQLQLAQYQMNMRISRKFAERQYGADEVAAVHDWAVQRCDEDPLFNHQMRTSDDPYEAAFQARNRERILETVKPDQLDAFLAWQAAQAAAQASAPTPTPPSAAAPPPRSLVSAPNAGGGTNAAPVGPERPYEALPFN